MDALSRDEETLTRGLPLRDLRHALPRDRSNRRRVILSLIKREDLQWVKDEETGERRLKLGWLAALGAWAAHYQRTGEDEARETYEQRITLDKRTIPPHLC